MIRHWTTLAALAHELERTIVPAVLECCYCNSEGEVCFLLHTSSESVTLVAALDRPIQSVYVHRFPPPRERAYVLKVLDGRVVEHIAIAEANRVLTLQLGELELVIVAIPGAQANCVVRDRNDHHLIDAVRRQRVQQGEQWEVPSPKVVPPESMPAEATVAEVLERSTLLLAAPYAGHFCRTHGVEPSQLWGMLGEGDRRQIVAAAVQYRTELVESPTPVLARSGGEELFLLAPVLEGWEYEYVGSVAEGVLRRVRSIYRQWAVEQRRSALLQRIDTEHRRIERALAALRGDIERAADAERYQLWGTLLISCAERHQRGLTQLLCTDWEGAQYHVPLDPALSVLENAERYFALARKLRRGEHIARERIAQLEQRAAELAAAREQLLRATDVAAIDQLHARLYPEQEASRIALPAQKSGRFRRFALQGGYVLLVGKDAASNDELTFRIARPHDVWLHARGVEGAHGLIPLPDRKLPPSSVIEQAAAIVAYYSRARSASYVPVSWTQRKYLRRPKRAATGAVEMLREEVIFVEPQLPSEAE